MWDVGFVYRVIINQAGFGEKSQMGVCNDESMVFE